MPKNRKKTAEKILVSFFFQKAVFETFFGRRKPGSVSSLSENARKGRIYRKLHDKMALEGRMYRKLHDQMALEGRMYRAGRVAGQGAPKNGRATVTRDELASTVEAVMPEIARKKKGERDS